MQPVSIPRLDAKAIGARLRNLRLERGLLQAYVARRAGIYPSVYSLVETGRRVPNLHQVILLCTLFRRSMEFVLFGLGRRGQLHRLKK